jgi:3-dehydroquinate synthase
MADIQVFDFEVKSRIRDYSLFFNENIKEILLQEIKPGDYIVIDSKVKSLYGELFDDVLSSINCSVIEASETKKSYEGTIPIIDSLIRSGFKKKNRLFAIGGGITQDVTSFIASVLYRGVDWIFIPTSLLAQGDSCIGSKTSINFKEFKNQIGGFYPPRKIFIDVQFLNSISELDFKSGLGELCHYVILSGKKDFYLIADNYEEILNDRSKLKKVISRSLQIKKTYIEQDEFDEGIRQLLNYGHSFGHAIESITNYKIPHGIAVAFGMDIANYISVEYGLLNPKTRNEIKNLLAKIWKGFDLNSLNTQALLHALSKDKKNVGNKLGLILLNDFGNGEKKLILPDEKFVGYIDKYLKGES